MKLNLEFIVDIQQFYVQIKEISQMGLSKNVLPFLMKS